MKFMIICGKNKGGDNDEGRNNAEKKAKELSGEWNNVLSVFFYLYLYIFIQCNKEVNFSVILV